jgi:D-glycero-D-manno-heptose 1,7-bisphosphate phosphatase
MLQQVARCNGRIDAIFFCPHAPSDDCACRKPRVGLLRDLGERLGTDLANATFVGDRASDVQAANAIGAKPILVKTGYGRKTLAGSVDLSMVSVYDDLSAAVEQLA